MRPSISALLPVHNAMNWIERALKNIESVLGKNDELIIVENGSTDGTQDYIRQRFFSVNLVLINVEEKGLVRALNHGLAAASHDWIARFDVDDYYEPDRIDKMMSFANSQTVILFSDFEFVDINGKSFGTIYNGIFDSAIKLSLPKSERNAHPSAIYSKEAVIKVGGYRETDFPCEDLSLWLRLSKMGEFRGVPSTLLRYSFLPNSISASNYDMIKSKSKTIVERFFDRQIIDIAFNQAFSTLMRYKGIPNGMTRRLLHLRDYFQPTVWNYLNLRGKCFIWLLLVWHFFLPSAWIAGISLFYRRMTRHRKRIRYSK